MLVHHLVGWFGGNARAALPGWPGFAVTDVAAPAFTVAMGAAVPLLVESRRRRGHGDLSVALVALRRYGLLIPLGIALRWAVGFDLGRLGVLETLGICALAVAALAPTVRPSVRLLTATSVLAAAPFVERAARSRGDWISTHVLTGTFPLVTYLGFALAGAALVPVIRRPDHRVIVAVVGCALALWTLALTAGGDPPDRYPGDVSFIVPGLAGTLLLYLVVTDQRLPQLVSQAVERAGAHTLGVFVGHYGVYVVLDRGGLQPGLAPIPAITLTLAVTAAIVSVAPRVPPLPWSPRTGRRAELTSRCASPVPRPSTTGACS